MAALDAIRRNIKAMVPEGEFAALAKRIGMPASLLHNYLSGIKDPGIAQLERIAAGLEVPLTELLKDEDIKPPPKSLDSLRLDAIRLILKADIHDVRGVLLALKGKP